MLESVSDGPGSFGPSFALGLAHLTSLSHPPMSKEAGSKWGAWHAYIVQTGSLTRVVPYLPLSPLGTGGATACHHSGI